MAVQLHGVVRFGRKKERNQLALLHGICRDLFKVLCEVLCLI